MNSLSLYELNNLVRNTLEMTMCDEYWVHAEISELRENRHCYLEFAQKDALGNGLMAKARGQIWANRWAYLRSHFESTTGQRLRVGMQVLVKVEVTFHELYGYSLNVLDIDPTYTLGDIARRRKEIMDKIRAEGIEDMNKELPLPRLIQRIAVISAATAAGHGDFCNQLHNNARGLAFVTKLFPATMQGNDVESSIVNALNAIANEQDNWDVVVIIRGGGATTDLAGFDSLILAENVAQFPLPIITGIGHERDDTIIDMVSHTRVKTPTAAAEFLIHNQEKELDYVNNLADRITNNGLSKIANEKVRLQAITSKMPSLYKAYKAGEEARLDRKLAIIQNSILQNVQRKLNVTAMREQQLKLYATALLNKKQNHLDNLDSKIKNADPQRILKLGFTVTRINGKAVKDVSLLKSGDIIETEFAIGRTISEIKDIKTDKRI